MLAFYQLKASLTDNLVGSQSGSGTSTFTLDVATHKKILCVAKSGTTIANVKEIPTSILNANDVIALGDKAPIVSSTMTNLSGLTQYTTDRPIGLAVDDHGGYYQGRPIDDTNGASIAPGYGFDLSADSTRANDVKVTYNGSNSFTITSISGVNVYVYA